MFGRKKKEEKKNVTSERPSLRETRRAFMCTIHGTGEINVENYGTLGDYSEEKIVLNGYRCKMTIEGEKLLIDYFTDVDMKITGKIRSIHF